MCGGGDFGRERCSCPDQVTKPDFQHFHSQIRMSRISIPGSTYLVFLRLDLDCCHFFSRIRIRLKIQISTVVDPDISVRVRIPVIFSYRMAFLNPYPNSGFPSVTNRIPVISLVSLSFLPSVTGAKAFFHTRFEFSSDLFSF